VFFTTIWFSGFRSEERFQESMMRSLSQLSRLAATAAILSSSIGWAQNSAVLPRIKAQIDDNKLTKLAGNVANLARTATDLGEADSSTQLTHIRLLLSRSTQQDQALNQYLADLQDKNSPSYHKWLTPEQFGKLYGPADSDIVAIVSWLESRGLKVEPVSPSRTDIAFSGSVSQVEAALHLQIHSFEGHGQQFYSNLGEPSIPSALTPVVTGIARLDTVRPTPHHVASQMGQLNPATKRLEPVSTHEPSKLRPNLTTGSGTNNDPYFLYMVPGDAATIYDTPNTTFNRNFTTGTSYTGTGVTIGIGGDAIISASTVNDFRTAFLGSNGTGTVTITNVDGVTSNSDADEAYIDTELSGGMAPAAAIHYYTSTDLFSAIDQAINDNTVDIFSLSFGACELDFSTADNALISTMWKQAAAQGIAVTVSTGDSGSAGCDATSDSQGNNVSAASGGLAVNGLASTPYNIAVGGTDMDGLLSSFSTYVDTNSSTDGVASTYFRSALNYIPESTWNDSTQADGTISANYPYTGSDANIVGGSGGKSSCSTNTTPANEATQGTCTSGYAKPSWQRGTGVPSDSARDLPDVSLMAGNGYDPATWLVCTDDTGQNGSGTTVTANCTTQSDGSFYFLGYGGTSTAAPAFAGVLAIVQQKAGGRLGQAAVELYDLYNGSHSGAIFHDTTVGNNSVSCNVNTPNCAKNTAGYYYLSGYDTTTGYDLATGMGSVDVNQLVTYWGSGVGATKPTVTVTPTPASITVSSTQSISVLVSVTGSATSGSGATASPTGTVTLTAGTYTSTTAALANGSYAFTVPAADLALGSNTATASYAGDINFAAATGTATITVAEPTGATFTLSAANVSVAPGSTGTSAITAAGAGGYVGPSTITLSGCTLSTSPSGAVDSPTCSITAASVTFASGASSGSGGTVSIGTTAASGSAVKAEMRGKNSLVTWSGVGTVALAGLLLFGIPARNRKWRALLGGFIFLAVLGFASGCGGSGGGTKTPSVPGTTPGTYTFTITGTDSFGTKVTGTISVTVS
jgi:subtilase family serine protease